MSTPAELSARLRHSWPIAYTRDVPPAIQVEAADCIDALQAQVEVLEAAIVKALLMHASGDLQIAYNDPTWLNQARAALSPIKASDADRREVKT